MSTLSRPHNAGDEYVPVDLQHPYANVRKDSMSSSGHGHPVEYSDYSLPPSHDHSPYSLPGDTLNDNSPIEMGSQAHLPSNAQPPQGYPPPPGPTPVQRPPGVRYAGLPSTGSTPAPSRPNSRLGMWGSGDLMSGIKNFEHSYEQFDSRNASEAHLAFADGDMPKNKLSRLYNYLLNVSIVTRWILFIVPVLAIIWIPGILALTGASHATIGGVGLLWWTVWVSVAWVGWWAALAGSRMLPVIVRSTVGLVAVGSRKYIDWMAVLHRYVALTAWTAALWITFQPLIKGKQSDNASDESKSVISLMAKLLFAFLLCAGVLLAEKFAIQWIAGKFHERSYAERIADQKFAVHSLVTLYRHSSDIPGRSDTLKQEHARDLPRNFIKRALKGVRVAATTTTTAFGNVASEIAGSSVLQPNSPQAMVKTALESANKSRLLARRLFYSFAQPGQDFLLVTDIARFFPTRDAADAVFALFDKDGNGDASRDEVEMACMEFHREQLSIEHSMQDLDSAVGRLDNVLMSFYVPVAILIIAVALEAQLTTLITGAGTAILGLSWLIGGALSDILTSIIFLFVKHPFDVGDRVTVGKATYTVKEIRLLSTIFLDANGTYVQAPNTELTTSFIQNIRRSPQMSETFTFEVSYATTFEQLEQLRDKMLAFVKTERRDYQPAFDVAVVDFPEQESMSLTADIKYKSNWQQGPVKAKRRNKWICALKIALKECKIFGPKGDPDKDPDPKKYTLVPWDECKQDEKKAERRRSMQVEPQMPRGGFQLMDKKVTIMDDSEDIFNEGDEINMTNPRRGGPPRPPGAPPRSERTDASPAATLPRVPYHKTEDIEMATARAPYS